MVTYAYSIPDEPAEWTPQSLRDYRHGLGLTLQEFAWGIGGRYQTVSELEHGVYAFSERMKKLLTLSRDDLVAWSKQKQREAQRAKLKKAAKQEKKGVADGGSVPDD